PGASRRHRRGERRQFTIRAGGNPGLHGAVALQPPKKRGRPRKDSRKPTKLLRVPLDVYNRLVTVAAANDRPVTWEGRRALLAFVEMEESRLGIKSPNI